MSSSVSSSRWRRRTGGVFVRVPDRHITAQPACHRASSRRCPAPAAVASCSHSGTFSCWVGEDTSAGRCPALLGSGCLRIGLLRVRRGRVGCLRIGLRRVGSLPRILGGQGLRPGAGPAVEEMGPCSLPRELVLLLPCQFGTLLRAMSALLLVLVLLVSAH